jgi:SAM-dependent methyltransferase
MTIESIIRSKPHSMPATKILDIGCGKSKVPGSIGVDFNENLGADVVHNLNVFPYPFQPDEFDEVHIRSTLFLLDNPVHVMDEIYRICKKGGRVVVVQPYFRSVWNYVDPWVKNFGTAHSFAFYDPDDLICKHYKYTEARFSTTNIVFDDHLEKPKIIRRLIIWLANRYPRKYELHLSYLFPLDMITFELKKI